MAKSKPRVIVEPPKEKTQEELAALVAAANMQPITVPEWYVAGAQLTLVGNDAILMLTKPILFTPPPGAAVASLAAIAPVGQLRMSLATLKDIAVLLSTQVALREAELGEIETDYTKRKKTENTKKRSKMQ